MKALEIYQDLAREGVDLLNIKLILGKQTMG